MGIPRSQLTDGNWLVGPDGTFEPAESAPFHWGLFPWLWRRLTGYRDECGRKAQFIGWREGLYAALFESWSNGL